MITFLDSQQIERNAQVGFSTVQSVNGELSVKGTIYTNDDVLKNIDRGWRFRLNDEYYRIVYVKPIDTGKQIEVEFDAVHQFFYDMAKSSMYEVLDGTYSLRYYLEAIFKNSGYKFDLDVDVKSIRKSDFGCKSRLSLFNDIIKTAGVEFLVSGHLVRIRKSIGSDQSTLVRKNFNMNEITIEKDINSFVTYQKGFGAWKDETDRTKGRYESEYESPLAKIYGRIEAEPVVDERYKETGKLLERLKQNVDNSYKISIAIDMEDLSAAGYKTSTPKIGDYIMAINETLGIRKRVRIVSLESNYDVSGKLIKRKVVCNDIGSVQRYSSEMSVLSRSVSDSKNESSKAIETAVRALASAEGKNTNYFGDKKPLDNPPGTIKKGDRLFLTAGDETELYFWSGSEWVIEPTRFDKDKFNVEFDKKAEVINKSIQQVESEAATALATAGANASLIKETQKISEQAKKQLDLQFADYKQSVDGRLASMSTRVDGKVNLVDFQQVRETSQLYERIIGRSESDIAEKVARMAMTNQLFQVEVAKYSTVGGPNMIRNSRADDGLKYWTEANSRLNFTAHSFYFNGQKRMFELRPAAVVKSPRFIVKRNADYVLNILGFDNNSKYFRVYFCKRKKGSSANFEQKQLIFDGQPRWVDGPVFDNTKTAKKSFKFNVGDYDDGYLQFEYDRNNPNKWGGLFMTELDFYEGDNDRKWQPAPEDATMETDKTLEATQTKMTQLAGSWAVKNINSAGDIISGINLGADGRNRLIGKSFHITGETLIDNAVIKSAMIESVLADKITTGTLNAANVNIINLNANKIVGLDATFLRGKIENAIIDWLVGKTLISQNGSTTLNLQTGVFTLNNEDSSIMFSRSSDNTATSFSKNGIHFFKNRKFIASIGQSAFSSIHDNKHKSGFAITLPNDQGISFSGYNSSSFFEINPYEESLSIQSGFSLLIGVKTSQSVSLEHVVGTTNDVNFSGFRAKGTRRQELRFYADGRIEITTRG
ncbi:phage tail protein [Streptococcus oralis]|uniref:phage tail protein n=1 Tax=Streptococcus oralis TaxID=1303 RepID=UPI0020C91B9D|nr:phage tail protein [Streptococcus oralis]MCP9037507.1 phage tail protein [Streptococcus oralis]MCP9052962.1 phage tail protein [Streptococcus oralis]MCP9057993.1 phage tail protein [Streptococcus oralis]MCP9065226.1 phage tail protein [Streptococcus oralis]MCP9069787.1 phage tail protein [Streptococcus oralis]